MYAELTGNCKKQEIKSSCDNILNIGSAILQNYERAQDILQTSLNSEGSAQRENEKFLQSVQGHLEKLQAKWESFSVSLADSTGLKVIIDAGGAVVTVLDKMTGSLGSLATIAAPTAAALSKFANVGKLNMPSYAETATHRMLAA